MNKNIQIGRFIRNGNRTNLFKQFFCFFVFIWVPQTNAELYVNFAETAIFSVFRTFCSTQLMPHRLKDCECSRGSCDATFYVWFIYCICIVLEIWEKNCIVPRQVDAVSQMHGNVEVYF